MVMGKNTAGRVKVSECRCYLLNYIRMTAGWLYLSLSFEPGKTWEKNTTNLLKNFGDAESTQKRIVWLLSRYSAAGIGPENPGFR